MTMEKKFKTLFPLENRRQFIKFYLIILILFTIGYSNLFAQNIILNSSMTSPKGENVVAPSWVRVRTGLPANSPDVNDENGNLHTTSGWVWYNGIPINSPDGGTWQNVFNNEDFSQTITGLTVGATYYFRYYYTTQGIMEKSSGTTYSTPKTPHITVTGLSNYVDPSNAGNLFEWNTYYGSLIATTNTASITATSTTDTYLAYDGFYLSNTPLSYPLITSQPGSAYLCQTSHADFVVIANNATSYQWQVNTGSGWSDIIDNATYSSSQSSNLDISNATVNMNNYSYRCKIGNSCCIVYSASAVLTVADPLTPALVITASPSSTCENAPTTFSAKPTNGGNSPSYQWKKNGVNVGTNSSSYIDNLLNNGDVISCTLTSNESCATSNTANSNPIVIDVISTVTPTVLISASTNNICSGVPVIFTTTIANGGPSPTFAWFKNNLNLSLNSPTYTDNSLKNGDVITCSMISSLYCVTSMVATSSPITMFVVPSVSPSISITSSANSVCKNTPVAFIASSINGGSTPFYQWKKNGIPVGDNNNNYTDNSLINGDMVTCTITSSSNCTATPQATSNTVNITVHPDPVLLLDKNNSLCEGNTRILDAGSFSSYLWNTGSANRTISINNFGLYAVTVTDINGCIGTDSTNITIILPSPTKFLPSDTSICSYGSLLLKPNFVFQNYLWNTGSNKSSITITQSGQYWLQVENNFGCKGIDTIMILPKNCLQGFFMPTAFTPNNDGKNDAIKPILLGNVKQYHFWIYNRWGQLIFQTSDISKGWNGTYKGLNQDANAFVWACAYQFEGEPLQNKKGTFVLIR